MNTEIMELYRVLQSELMSTLFISAQNFLRADPQLEIISSDKMNVTTIIDTNQYNYLALEILNDREYYQILTRDPSSTIQQKANSIIKDLDNKKFLSKEESKKYKVYDGVINKFYGLPKIHKPNLSLRPIISGNQSPNRGIAQLITDILTIAYEKDNDYFVEDSFKFCEFINEFQLP